VQVETLLWLEQLSPSTPQTGDKKAGDNAPGGKLRTEPLAGTKTVASKGKKPAARKARLRT
jgi:hypothetical protein